MRSFKYLSPVLAAAIAAGTALAEPSVEKAFSDKDRAYWAFQPVKRAAVPDVGEANPVDAFISAKLAAKGLRIA